MSQQALLGKTLEELQQIALEFGEPKFRGKQLAEWLCKKSYHRGDDQSAPKVALTPCRNLLCR